MAFLRGAKSDAPIAAVFNFSGILQGNYRFGVPHAGIWIELLNSDGLNYGGGGVGNSGRLQTVPIPLHGFLYSLTATLPALGAIWFRLQP